MLNQGKCYEFVWGYLRTMNDPLVRDALRQIQDIVTQAKGSPLHRDQVARVEKVLARLAAPEHARDADTGVAGDQAFVWKGAAAPTGAAELGYYRSGGDTILRASIDGDAAAELEIQIKGIVTPTSAWLDL